MYETVLNASEIGLKKVKSGVKASDVHNAVEDYINSTKYNGRFIHSTGHSIGLNVHDGASISRKSPVILEEGMAFTIEPGVYLPKIGGVRIEDDVIVRKNGPEILTKVIATAAKNGGITKIATVDFKYDVQAQSYTTVVTGE